MEIIVFDIFGDYGHFRKYWTTTSPLTFSFIPPTALYGIIAAIIGIDKNEYLKIINYQTIKFSQRIINPINKTRMGINLINTKDNIKINKDGNWFIKDRTQIRFEFLKNPHFRIYIQKIDENTEKLETFLKENKNFYTISLGLSELIAKVKYIGTLEASENITENVIDIHSIIPEEKIKYIKFEEGKKYIKERVPLNITVERKILSFKDIVAEINADTIKCIPEKYIEVKGTGENIVFI